MANKNSIQLPQDSVGRVMVSDVPIVLHGQSVAAARSLVLKGIHRFVTVHYIYVVDADKKLVGTVSIRELFGADNDKKVSEVMTSNIFSLHPRSDQERAVVLALRHNIKAVPVIDYDKKFLGVVPSDRIIKILHEEHVEDLLRVAGVRKSVADISHLGKESIFELFRRRTPSLLAGLAVGVIAAWWISSFEHIIEAEFLLAAFIPAIVYLSDAVGTQTQTLFIRDLTFAELFKVSTYIIRELKLGFLMAAALAILFMLSVFLVGGSFKLGLILGTTLIISVFAAIVTALCIPWLLSLLKRDPALASGPFSTAISDIFSLVIYFLVASTVLRLFA